MTTTERLFAIEARLDRRVFADTPACDATLAERYREDFTTHIQTDLRWLLTLQNEMWSALPTDVQARFRDRDGSDAP